MPPSKRQIAARKAAETRASKKEGHFPAYCGDLVIISDNFKESTKKLGAFIGKESKMIKASGISKTDMAYAVVGREVEIGKKDLKNLGLESLAVKNAVDKLCKFKPGTSVSCVQLKEAMNVNKIVSSDKKVAAIKGAFKDLKCVGHN